ncbi:MAG TPA: TrbI/VirB10 family protein, partial [Terriglobales bacterium]|nr:TrbI/VirB10 family protein [Terriglobales bacterium]
VEDSPSDFQSERTRNAKTPFVPRKAKAKQPFRDGGMLFIGAGIVLVLVLFAFSGISRRSSPMQKRSAKGSQTQPATPGSDDVKSTSLTPILDAGRSLEQRTDQSHVEPDQIGRLGKKEADNHVARRLADVPPFGNSENWQPAPYQLGVESSVVQAPAEPAATAQSSNNREVSDKPSLVFVRNNTSAPSIQKSQEPTPQIDPGIDLPPGTRLRARLESAISTAVTTPVVATIEYNYEQNGEIAIPAGAKAFGHLETADRSGYLGIRFDSLQMPDGSSFSLDAGGTDLRLRPLRGKVEGKHAGKSIFIRSFAGVGEIAATLVGRGSLNQPLNENDLLRERLTNNIGQASDQSVASLALTEHVVVSVPAGTEIYVILQKTAKEKLIQNPHAHSLLQISNQPSMDELRQLLQLQREFNQTPTAQSE